MQSTAAPRHGEPRTRLNLFYRPGRRRGEPIRLWPRRLPARISVRTGDSLILDVTISSYWQGPERACKVSERRIADFLAEIKIMTWIRTIRLSEADDELRRAAEGQRSLYPIEYATPVHPAEGGGAQIVESHSLIPQALYHAFATFGSLMSPDLPLTRRQHEMITTVVSVTNRCVY
jgi:hypothetical protein